VDIRGGGDLSSQMPISIESSGPAACARALPAKTFIAGIEPAIITTNERMDTRSSPRIVDSRETAPA
jgi:hypothetical protein